MNISKKKEYISDYKCELDSPLAFCPSDTNVLCEWYAYIVYIHIYVYMFEGRHTCAYMCVCMYINAHITYIGSY